MPVEIHFPEDKANEYFGGFYGELHEIGQEEMQAMKRLWMQNMQSEDMAQRS